MSSELVSDNHRLYIDNKLQQNVPEGKYKQNRFTYAGNSNNNLVEATTDKEIDTNLLKLLTWIVMDGCIYVTSPTKREYNLN